MTLQLDLSSPMVSLGTKKAIQQYPTAEVIYVVITQGLTMHMLSQLAAHVFPNFLPSFLASVAVSLPVQYLIAEVLQGTISERQLSTQGLRTHVGVLVIVYFVSPGHYSLSLINTSGWRWWSMNSILRRIFSVESSWHDFPRV